MNNQYALSGGHEKTLEIAADILEAGGNAFDAAIAAHLAMYVTEPCMASPGAGGFALCHSNGRTEMLDFFTQTPLSRDPDIVPDFEPIVVNFGNETETFHIGLASAATPGSVAGLFELYERYASMPINRIVEPVIELAQKGLPLNTFQSIDIGLLEPVFARDKSVRSIFFKEGKVITEGDHFRLPQLVNFLELLVDEGADGFYKGEISRMIDKDSRERGGFIRRQDFESYKAIWRKPLSVDYKGLHLQLANGPSLGGAIAAILFNYQDQYNDWLRSIVAFKSKELSMDAIEAEVNRLYGAGTYALNSKHNSSRGTSHFNILDRWGNAIALTCTIGEGCGYAIPGTDMQLNNMMGESFLLPEGFHNWTPDVRLNSMMAPAMMLDRNGALCFVCGSGGAGRIPFMIAQMADATFVKGMSLNEAMHNPRIYLHHGTVHYESGYSESTDMGYPQKEWTESSLFFGGVHAIMIRDGLVEACGDHRRFGASLIYPSA